MERADLDKYDLPDNPGVYIFRGPRKEILYVGKATSLRDRVRSYFASDLGSSRGARIVAMVENAAALTWQECGSVLEALILEANLIKRYQPPYNVDEKDNKSWNYVVITKEAFPRVLAVRGRELHQWESDAIGRVFGPYPEGGSLKEALKIVRKIFPYRDTCIPCPEQMSKAKPYSKCRPCFNAQLGLCSGVCSGAMNAKDYAATIRHITQLFSGNMQGLKRALEKEMREAAAQQEYEKAAALRAQAGALEHIRDVSLIKSPVASEGSGSVRIEAYDVAHTAGQETVGVMVAVARGVPVKSSYRKFKIQGATNDDPAALAELLLRRLAHPEWLYPTLIVVDGGALQLRAAERVLAQIGVQIPIVGVVKDERHRPQRLIGDERAIALHEREILLANSEAHRFAISWHRARRQKRLTA